MKICNKFALFTICVTFFNISCYNQSNKNIIEHNYFDETRNLKIQFQKLDYLKNNDAEILEDSIKNYFYVSQVEYKNKIDLIKKNRNLDESQNQFEVKINIDTSYIYDNTIFVLYNITETNFSSNKYSFGYKLFVFSLNSKSFLNPISTTWFSNNKIKISFYELLENKIIEKSCTPRFRYEVFDIIPIDQFNYLIPLSIEFSNEVLQCRNFNQIIKIKVTKTELEKYIVALEKQSSKSNLIISKVIENKSYAYINSQDFFINEFTLEGKLPIKYDSCISTKYTMDGEDVYFKSCKKDSNLFYLDMNDNFIGTKIINSNYFIKGLNIKIGDDFDLIWNKLNRPSYQTESKKYKNIDFYIKFKEYSKTCKLLFRDNKLYEIYVFMDNSY